MIYCIFEMPFISNVQRRILSTTVGDTRAKWWGIGWAKRKRYALNVEYEILDLLVFFFASEGQKWNWMRVENIACTCNLWFVTLARCALSRALLLVWQSEWARVFLLAKILIMTSLSFSLSLSLSLTLPPTKILLACPGMKQCYELTASLCLPVDWSMRCFLVVSVLSLSFSSLLYYSLFYVPFFFFFEHNASCVWTGEVINPRLSESIHRHRRCREPAVTKD